ncbi:Dihydrolipoamide dehydrogenase of pyruvate dehydrogenase complex [Thioalkalivibrio nitratireducens DSM 14787]|uniref:Dihydrolipoyl dehydrogenase n=1 Tax=Thioalkalivibrio nitratireducens (strain DSM 14787 / UNIQEM 213 / ALEN2) TaxID=1255043 RepID=L0E160_THIND|nr:NAD(P)/FAD-dependent oxidoreductase [Thioalkalivibrio nitratireducens]AGA35038.1 Dihydrolipoamide dehydrogenase of pyruvate dehydrogenase complex [Thioalkalivibrio nitratireducens DSM 14787]
MTGTFDLAVIGSGPGGYRAAVLGALRGLDVVLVERDRWGGCCLNRGCVPKKAWYHSARLIASQHTFAARGIRGSLAGDLAAAWNHQRGVVDRVRESYRAYLKHLKVETRAGHARFAGPGEIDILGAEGSDTVRARHTIIATGAAPIVPEPFRLASARVLTTDDLFDRAPPAGARVAVIGSGVVATEFAFILQLLGREVTWLSRSRPLARLGFSVQALTTLNERLQAQGIEPRRIRAYAKAEIGRDTVAITTESGERFEVDWVLLGTGRQPVTADLGLERVGVGTDRRGFIERGPTLQTAAAGVYAIGDVAGDSMTANHALSDATVAVANILGEDRRQDGRFVPTVVYSAVEMARLGLNEDMAEDEGHEPAVGFAAFETSPRALGQDEPEGFVRLIGDLDTGALLGGEIVGGDAGELIHLLSLAPDRETALAWLARGTWNHPARAEEILNATETMAAKWQLQDPIFGRRHRR